MSLGKIYSKPLDDLRGQVIELTPYATDCRYYRSIDAKAFVNESTLTLYETDDIVCFPFWNAISYVWLGLEASGAELESDGSFRVYCGVRSDGTLREDGGTISVKVLGYACLYCVSEVTFLLWLDRLCIKQTSTGRDDKAWQIMRMHEIYRDSA